MLQEETDKGDANPAAGTEENRLTAFLDEVHKVCVEPNGSHGKNDENLLRVFIGPKTAPEMPK